MTFENITIIGGGSLGHVIAGWLSSRGYKISILTRNPSRWENDLTINSPKGKLDGHLQKISQNPKEVITTADIVLLTVPGYANESELKSIRS